MGHVEAVWSHSFGKSSARGAGSWSARVRGRGLRSARLRLREKGRRAIRRSRGALCMLHEPGTGEPDPGTTVGGGRTERQLAAQVAARPRASSAVAGSRCARSGGRGGGDGPARLVALRFRTRTTVEHGLVVVADDGVEPGGQRVAQAATVRAAGGRARASGVPRLLRGTILVGAAGGSGDRGPAAGAADDGARDHELARVGDAARPQRASGGVPSPGAAGALVGAGNVCRQLRSRASMEVRRQRVASPAEAARGTTC